MTVCEASTNSFPQYERKAKYCDTPLITLFVVGLLFTISATILYGASINYTAAYVTAATGATLWIGAAVLTMKRCITRPTGESHTENLLEALKQGNPQSLRLALQNPSFMPEKGLELLNLAASQGNAEIVRELLNRGIEPGNSDDGDHTIIYAIEANHGNPVEVLSFLFENDPMAVSRYLNFNNSTPLQVAVRFQRPDIVRYLIENGADLNAQGGTHLCSGFTALHYVLPRPWSSTKELPNLDIIEILARAGADPRIKARGCNSPEWLFGLWKKQHKKWYEENKEQIDTIESIWAETVEHLPAYY